MSSQPPTNIGAYFSDLPDPRSGNNISHPLINIITITICGVICGAVWKGQAPLVGDLLNLKHGIPSHDRIGRVFRLLHPDEFEQRFYEWTQGICKLVEGEVLAVDGKQLRRSKDGTLGLEGIYMVNVWATANRLSLAQAKVENHTNEVSAIPLLLKLLEIEDTVITIDAIGCQTDIVEVIIDRQADYVIAVKGNQDTLLDDVQAAFETEEAQRNADYDRIVNKGHGWVH